MKLARENVIAACAVVGALITFAMFIQNGFSGMNDRISELGIELNGRISELDAELNGRISELGTELNDRISALDDKVDAGFERVDQRLLSLDQRVSRIEGHLFGLEPAPEALPSPEEAKP